MVTFKSEKITEHLTRIHGITGELMYLAEGTQKAALVDTGSGIGSLLSTAIWSSGKVLCRRRRRRQYRVQERQSVEDEGLIQLFCGLKRGLLGV